MIAVFSPGSNCCLVGGTLPCMTGISLVLMACWNVREKLRSHVFFVPVFLRLRALAAVLDGLFNLAP